MLFGKPDQAIQPDDLAIISLRHPMIAVKYHATHTLGHSLGLAYQAGRSHALVACSQPPVSRRTSIHVV
jgi:hypothetical protein